MEFLDVTQRQDVTIVRPLLKRLDAAVAPAFKDAVNTLVQSGRQTVVLDLGPVQFMDSSGLGALVSILKNLGSKGKLAVCNTNGAVSSLFKLTRMDKVFVVAESIDDAIRQIAG